MGTEPGVKLDQSKVDPSFVMEYFPRALLAVSEVAGFGARKYTRGGWRSVPNGIQRYTAAHDRHRIAEEIEGPYDEQDSHLLHAAQVAWNALARLELMLIEGRTVWQPTNAPTSAASESASQSSALNSTHHQKVKELERDLHGWPVKS